MPNFKPKKLKKIKNKGKNKITLDKKHKEKMLEFNNIKNNLIPNIDNEIKSLKENFKNTNDLEEKLTIKQKIKELTFQKKQEKQKEKQYLLQNSKYIFKYFEKKKNLSLGNTTNKKNILNEFFNKETNKDNEKTYEFNANVNSYLTNIDKNYIDIENYKIKYDVCSYCSGELIPIENLGVLVCKKCSRQTNFLIEHEKPSYKEPPKEVCFYAYKRINHFREILAQFQAKETTQIPDKVLSDIKEQIKKERIDLKQMTNKKAKDILKKLGYNKFYEHIPFIKDKLGIKPPVMKPELEEKLCNLFMDIQQPYSRHCPDTRVNFLNYYYFCFS